jgi:hypothetical protein
VLTLDVAGGETTSLVGGGEVSCFPAGGEGSISPIPVSPVPKLTRIPSPVSETGGEVENPARMSRPNSIKCINVVPRSPFFLTDDELLKSLFNLGCNYLIIIFYSLLSTELNSANLRINEMITGSIMPL